MHTDPRGRPVPQAFDFWKYSYKTRRMLTFFSQGARWPFIFLGIAFYNFKYRDDSHMLRYAALLLVVPVVL